jgi:hypothetical protein
MLSLDRFLAWVEEGVLKLADEIVEWRMTNTTLLPKAVTVADPGEITYKGQTLDARFASTGSAETFTALVTFNGGITVTGTVTLPTGSITSAMILNNTILGEDIAANAVRNSELAADAVHSINIKDNEVGNAKLVSTGGTEAVNTNVIRANAVTGAKIANLAVDTAQLANLAVTNAKIAADAVDTGKIANQAVNADRIAPGAVTSAKLADNIKFGSSASSTLGFYGAAGAGKPTITGATAAVALRDLLNSLAARGLIVDNTTF